MRLKKRTGIWMYIYTIIGTVLMAMFSRVYIANAQGLTVNMPSQEQIMEYLSSNEINIEEEVLFDVEPSKTSPYNSGRISEQSLDNATNVYNAVRFIAGLEEVTHDYDYDSGAQTAALVNACTGLSHKPKCPEGMSDAMYSVGYKYSGKSNLAAGFNNLGKSIVYGWMSDNGHRRWCLSPKIQSVGFGYVNKVSAMYVMDNMQGSVGDYLHVAWPAKNMPVEFFSDGGLWTVSVGPYCSSKYTVTLTRLNDGKVMTFKSGSTDDGYSLLDDSDSGAPPVIAFLPNLEYNPGDSFHVLVKGAHSYDIEYEVSFFSAEKYMKWNPVEIKYTNISYIESQYYTGSTLKPEISIQYGKKTLEEGIDYTVVYSDNVGPGEAVITISGLGRFTGEVQKTFRIFGKLSDDMVQLGSDEVMETGSVCKADVKVIFSNGIELKEYTDYTLLYKDNTQPGNAQVEIRGCGNYMGSIIKSFTILENPDLDAPEEPKIIEAYSKGCGLYTSEGDYYSWNSLVSDGKVKTESSEQGVELTYVSPEICGSLYLSEAITDIDGKAFENCVEIVSIKLPKKLVTVDEGAFSGCLKLTEFVGYPLDNFLIVNLALYDKDREDLLCCPPGREIEYNQQAYIHYYAMKNCSKLKEIVIGWSSMVDKEALKDCSSLEKVDALSGSYLYPICLPVVEGYHWEDAKGNTVIIVENEGVYTRKEGKGKEKPEEGKTTETSDPDKDNDSNGSDTGSSEKNRIDEYSGDKNGVADLTGTSKIKKLKYKNRVITIKLNKVSQAEGYQIQIASNIGFTKNKKTYNSYGGSGYIRLSKKQMKKYKGKYCYVRVRACAFDIDQLKTVYGDWSIVKKVKIKK